MYKIVIYALGKLFEQNKKYIQWDEVVALSDEKVCNVKNEKQLLVIAPEKLKYIEFDYIAIFSNKYFENIKRKLICEFFIDEKKIVSWEAIVKCKKYMNLNGVYFLEKFIQENKIKNLLDCSNDGILSYKVSKEKFNKNIDMLDRLNLNVHDIYLTYDNLYENIILCKKTYEIVYSDNYHKFVQQYTKLKAKYYIVYIDFADNVGIDIRNQFESNFSDIYYITTIILNSGYVFILQNNEVKQEINCNIYVVTHKKYNMKNDFLYKPIIVGNGYCNPQFYNDRGIENITDLNDKINECTALYWIWKNIKTKYIGFNHYRRYFLNNNIDYYENILHSENIRKLLINYDIILGIHEEFGCTILEQIENTVDLDAFNIGYNIVREALKKAHPEDMEVFDYVMNLHYFYPCNIFITSWYIFDKYCEWLFSFIIDAARNIDVSNYDNYSKRIIGFFAERMLTVWVIKNNLKVKELPFITIE